MFLEGLRSPHRCDREPRRRGRPKLRADAPSDKDLLQQACAIDAVTDQGAALQQEIACWDEGHVRQQMIVQYRRSGLLYVEAISDQSEEK